MLAIPIFTSLFDLKICTKTTNTTPKPLPLSNSQSESSEWLISWKKKYGHILSQNNFKNIFSTCAGLNRASFQIHIYLETQNVSLFGNSVFANVIS